MYNLNGENVNDNTSQTYSAPTPDNSSYQPYTDGTGNMDQQTYQQTGYGQGTYDQNLYNQQTYTGQTYAGQTYTSPTGNGGSTYNAAPGGYNPYNQEKKPTPVFAVLGIIFVAAALISGWFIPAIGFLFAIAALVMGILAVGRRSSIRGLGIADIILSVCALIFLIVVTIVRALNIVSDLTDNSFQYKDSLDNDFSFDFDHDDDDDYDFDDDDDFSFDEEEDGFYGWEDWSDDIEDAVIYSENGITITATSVDYMCFGDSVSPTVNLLIENDTDRNIYISTDYCAINNIAMDSYIYESVNAHKKLETDLTVNSALFSLCRFTDVGNIQLYLSIEDEDTSETLVESDHRSEATLNDSYTPFGGDTMENAQLVASVEGCDFYYLGVSSSPWGGSDPYFQFVVENNTGRRIWAETDDYSTDDYMQNDYDIDTLEDGNCTFLFLECPDNMDSIQQAAVTFEVTFYDTMDVYYSDEIVFYTKQ